MKTTAVIMAGGTGSRFWPRGRRYLPKQFLSFTNDKQTMIQLTAERLLPIVSYEDMFVVTNRDYVELVKEQLPAIPEENILAEPTGRNTAAAIGFAAAIIEKIYKDAIMMVLASDHLIKNEVLYVDTMSLACDAAKIGENLVTVGIMPTYPETGYGYIKFGKKVENGTPRGSYIVEQFIEKPSVETAKEYLESGNYLWNSGMFVWKSSTILKKLKEFLPHTESGVREIAKVYNTLKYELVLEEKFAGFENVSIDYAVLEQAENIYTIPGNFGWDDVGSWLAMERINRTNESGNIVLGDVITINTENSIIVADKKLIATIGLEDVIIVDTEDALLVCDKDSAQDVKQIIEHLKNGNRQELL